MLDYRKYLCDCWGECHRNQGGSGSVASPPKKEDPPPKKPNDKKPESNPKKPEK